MVSRSLNLTRQVKENGVVYLHCSMAQSATYATRATQPQAQRRHLRIEHRVVHQEAM